MTHGRGINGLGWCDKSYWALEDNLASDVIKRNGIDFRGIR
jgi:hypothetical protein